MDLLNKAAEDMMHVRSQPLPWWLVALMMVGVFAHWKFSRSKL